MLPPVLIVEDDLKLARIVKAYLEAADFRTIHAASYQDALHMLGEETPLAVILDLGLPDGSGEELCQDIKEQGDIPVIMLTAKSAEEERIAGFSLGADDYVVKPASPRELVYRLKAVLKRYHSTVPAAQPLSFNRRELVLNPGRHEISFQGSPVPITATEFKLLLTMASQPQKTFSREELVSKALGYHFDGYERSIDAHIKNLRHKLEADPKNPVYLKTVYGVGYLFCGIPDAP